MNHAEFIRALSADLSISNAQAQRTLDAVLQRIEAEVSTGDGVRIAGFGQFHAVERPARTLRIPTAAEPVEVAAHRVVRFTPAKALRLAANGRA